MHRLRSGAVPPLLLPLTALAAACSAGRDAAPSEVESWTLEGPTLRIGTLDEGPEALTSVADLVSGPSGEVFVLLPQDHQVRVFDASGGGFVRSIGREGQGPGELQRPQALGFLGDTLWVQDPGLRKVALYTAAGELLGDRAYPGVEVPDEGLTTSFGGPLPGGSSLVLTSAAFQSDLEGTDHPFPVLVAPPPGAGGPDTVAYRNLAHDRAIFIDQAGGQIVSVSVLRQMFSDQTLWDVSQDGRDLVLVDRPVAEEAVPATFRLTRVTVDAEADTVFSVEVPYEPVPVPAAHVDSVLAPLLDGPLSEDRVREALFLPETYPPVSHVVAGTDGTVWVAREERPGRPVAWQVYGPDGSLLARLEAPPGLIVHQVDRTGLWGVVTDELDVPYVVRYRVDAGPEASTAPADGTASGASGPPR